MKLRYFIVILRELGLLKITLLGVRRGGDKIALMGIPGGYWSFTDDIPINSGSEF